MWMGITMMMETPSGDGVTVVMGTPNGDGGTMVMGTPNGPPPEEFLLKGVRSPPRPLELLELPPGMSVLEALLWVLWLLAVASKRYLTNKVSWASS